MTEGRYKFAVNFLLASMKIIRRVCIGLVAFGALLLFARRDSEFDTLPFPGAGLAVKMEAKVKTDGDYYLRASMPKADKTLALSNESVPCTLTISVTREDKPPIKSEVTSLSRYAEYGFAEVQYYRGGDWHFTPGEYAIEISSRENCNAAMIRGATLSLEQQTTHITEHFLVSLLRFYGGVLFLCTGLLGLIICEFKRTNTEMGCKPSNTLDRP